jgi:hypothetical protein
MSNVMNQKDAVFVAVSQVLSNANVTFEEGTTVVKPLMTKELRAQVNQILFEGFRNKTIEMDGEKTDAELKQYVSGLQSNWINKDKRLNGTTNYAAKNPGSRAGITDPQIKAMRALLTTVESDDEKAEIQGFIDDRLATLNAGKTKSKAKAVDFSALPEELQAKYSTAE